ncbi:hypothetical protein C7212DRAFT_359104 [Tuber magnatum]|uniref:Prion-inhibition and propagation HeLo domain-containing protein n=1 Tax=Tuber magnatum TaxID=42249 RepID=A0A317SL57_9PEZI|nr:hypothetical protein C7212DRAFT_359104 [Tuber magnatum]
MDPLSVTSLVAGIPGLFTSCLQIYGLISSAASHGPDFQVMLSRVDVEHARFLLWGGTVGLIQSSTLSTGSGIDPRIIHPQIRETIAKILSCIQKSFDDTEKLKRRYGLMPGEGRSPLPPGNSMQLYGKSSPPPFLSLSIFKGIYERQQLAAIETQKQNSVLKRARWAISDKERFITAIEDLKAFNDSLHSLLPDIEWKTQERLRQEVLTSQDEDVLRLLQEASEGTHTGLNRAATIRLSRLNSRHQLPKVPTPASYELPATSAHGLGSTTGGAWGVIASLSRASNQDPYLEASSVEKPRSGSLPGGAALTGGCDREEHNASANFVELPGGDFNLSANLPSSRPPTAKRELEISALSRATEREALDVPEEPDIFYLAGASNLLDLPNSFWGGEVTPPPSDTISELSAENSSNAPKSGVQHYDDTSPAVTPNLTGMFYICIDFQDRGTRAAITHSSAPKDFRVVGGWPDNDTCDSYIQSIWVPSVLAYDKFNSRCRWGHQVQRSQDQASRFIAHLQGEKTGLMTYLERHGRTLQNALEEYFDHLLRHLIGAAKKKYGHHVYAASGIKCVLVVSNKWESSVCTPLRNAIQRGLSSIGTDSDVTLQVDTSLAASYISARLFTLRLENEIGADGNSVEGNGELFMVCHVTLETRKAIVPPLPFSQVSQPLTSNRAQTIQTFQAQHPHVINYCPPQSSAIGMQSLYSEFEKFLERYYEYTGIHSRKPYNGAQENWLGIIQDYSGGSNVWISCPYGPDCYECHCAGGELRITKEQMEGILKSFFAEGIYLCGELGSWCGAMCEYLRRELPEQSIYQLPVSATEVVTGATVAALGRGTKT